MPLSKSLIACCLYFITYFAFLSVSEVAIQSARFASAEIEITTPVLGSSGDNNAFRCWLILRI